LNKTVPCKLVGTLVVIRIKYYNGLLWEKNAGAKIPLMEACCPRHRLALLMPTPGYEHRFTILQPLPVVNPYRAIA